MSRYRHFVQTPAVLDHEPEIIALRAALGDKNAGMYAHRLWGWSVLNWTPRCHLPPPALAHVCEYDGDPGVFAEQLVAAGLLTHDGKICGWEQRYGAKDKRLKADAQRQRAKHAASKAVAASAKAPRRANRKAENQRAYRERLRAAAGVPPVAALPVTVTALPQNVTALPVTVTENVTALPATQMAQIASDMHSAGNNGIQARSTPKTKIKIENIEAAAPPRTNLVEAPTPAPAAAAAIACPAWVDEAPHSVEAPAPVEAPPASPPPALKPPHRVERTPAPGALGAPLPAVGAVVQDILSGSPRAALRAARSATAAAAPSTPATRGTHPRTTVEVRKAAEQVWPGRMSDTVAQQVIDGGWSWKDIDLVLGELKQRRGASSPQLLVVKLREDLPAMKKEATTKDYGGVSYGVMIAMRDAINGYVPDLHGVSTVDTAVIGRIAATGVSADQAVSVYAEQLRCHGDTTWVAVAEALERGQRVATGQRPPPPDDTARRAAAEMFARLTA